MMFENFGKKEEAKPPTTYIVKDELSSPRFGKAFADGCDGGTMTFDQEPFGDIALFGTIQYKHLLDQAKKNGYTYYYGDHSYFDRQRSKQYRVTKNALQHTGEGTTDGKRFRVMRLDILDWKQKRGEWITLCPNSERYMNWFGLTVDGWVEETTETLRLYTDRPIYVTKKHDKIPFQGHFKRTHAFVTYKSAAVINAAIHGIPGFATGLCAGNNICSDDLSLIETPPMSDDRERFFGVLADNQWTLDELRSGMAWKKLKGE